MKKSSIFKYILNGIVRMVVTFIYGVAFKLGRSSSNRSKPLFDCTSSVNSNASKFKIKTIFLFVLFVIAYICLNNYLIMFVYIKSSTTTSSYASKSRVTTTHLPEASSNVNKSFSNRFRSLFSSLFSSRSRDSLSDEDSSMEISNEISNSTDNTSVIIDPADLIEANLNMTSFLTSKKYTLLDDSYFNEKNSKMKAPKRVCFIPKLNAYDAEIMQFVKKETDLKCNPKTNWVSVENGTLRVSKAAIKKHGQILCAYLPLYRGNNDFTVNEGKRIFPIMDKFPIITDFFKVDCRSKDGGIYSNIHSGISYDPSLHMRHFWNPLPKKALGYNVLMFGFDSVSRMSWIRMLPQSYEYMLKEGFIVLKGYNIVGDGTPQNLLPILTGKKETELPEARRGFHNSSYVDKFPWIFKDYKKAGYVTQWAEDMQSIGTFQLRMLGFRKQPVDHFMRLFYLEAEKYYERFRRLCLGSISRHQNMINWAKEFFQMYESKPKFSFIFHSEASHNYNNPLSLIDKDLKEFLVYLKKRGIMDSTILLFMSDHGVRVSSVRQYSQGKLEERLPFFSIRMPRSFQEKYPNEMRNLRLNSRKLTTPFDIHETLKHFLSFSSANETKSNESKKNLQRGISLLTHIPVDRSCEDAQIEAHWCSCLNWVNLNTSCKSESLLNQIIDNRESDEKEKFDHLKEYSQAALRIAFKAVDYINELIREGLPTECEKIYLKSIEHLSMLNLNEKLLAFKESKDLHGRVPVFEYSNNTNQLYSLSSNSNNLFSNLNKEIVFQIVLSTWPGNLVKETMKYEMTLKYDKSNDSFKFGKSEISRINNYHNSSYCILNKRPDLRQFCYCKYFKLNK